MGNGMDNEPTQNSDWRHWLPILLLGSIWLIIFWPMLKGESIPAFRDSGLLYYPLFQWIDAQWAAGEIPLWNPWCNYGISVIGDGTSSVFYPGKLIFRMRFLPYPARYGIYLAGHLLLAAAGSYWLARTLKANRAGAMLAAVSHSFSGVVLFQVTNVIYLVSAAWLPVALVCVWKLVRTGELRHAVAAGTVCAMMILGGDPQMVYHVGLIAAATMVCRGWRHWRRGCQNNNPAQRRISEGHGFRLAKGISVLVAVTTLLSLVQLLPSYGWSRLSERSQTNLTVNLYHAIKTDFATARSELIGPPPKGTILHHAYQFSQPPWTVAEFFWPNFSGRIYPTHERWADGLPGADRVWHPSLYLGLLTIWLAICGMKFTGYSRRAWLTWIGLFFGIASFGWYGVGWLANEILPAYLRTEAVGPQVGGLYWLLMIALPKYYSFRYPAKLMVVATLCLCVLAGVNLRRWRLNFSKTWVGFFALMCLVGVFYLLLGLHEKFFDRVPDDGLFGPFDSSRATKALLIGLVQSAVILLLGYGIGQVACSRRRRKRSSTSSIDTSNRNWALWTIVGITVVDLVAANRWLLSDVPSHAFTKDTPAIDWLDTELARNTQSSINTEPLTLYRPRGAEFLPQHWVEQSSENRLDEILVWQRETLYPKQHLGRGVRLLGSFSSIWPQSYEDLLSAIEAGNLKVTDYAGGQLVDDDQANDSPVGIEWLGARRQFVFLLNEDGSAVSETETGDQEPAKTPMVEVTYFSNQKIVANVRTTEPQWAVLDTLFDGNWKANILDSESNETLVQQTVELAGCTQGILLEPGTYELEFYYAPNSFWIGAWVSGFTWLLLIGGWVWAGFRAGRRVES